MICYKCNNLMSISTKNEYEEHFQFIMEILIKESWHLNVSFIIPVVKLITKEIRGGNIARCIYQI